MIGALFTFEARLLEINHIHFHRSTSHFLKINIYFLITGAFLDIGGFSRTRLHLSRSRFCWQFFKILVAFLNIKPSFFIFVVRLFSGLWWLLNIKMNFLKIKVGLFIFDDDFLRPRSLLRSTFLDRGAFSSFSLSRFFIFSGYPSKPKINITGYLKPKFIHSPTPTPIK